jgi:hypothetical protein
VRHSAQREEERPVQEQHADPVRLWTDAPDGAAKLDRLAAAGHLTDRQAALLRTLRTKAFVALDRPARADRLDPAELDIERIFAGACPDMVFDCPALSANAIAWQPEVAPHPAVARDPHAASAAVRDLLLHDPVAEIPSLVLAAPLLLCASDAWLRPQQHLPAPHRFGGMTMWIALEDGVRLALPAADRVDAETAPVLTLRRGGGVLLHPSRCARPLAVPPLGTARMIVGTFRPFPGSQSRSQFHQHAGAWFAAERYPVRCRRPER